MENNIQVDELAIGMVILFISRIRSQVVGMGMDNDFPGCRSVPMDKDTAVC